MRSSGQSVRTPIWRTKFSRIRTRLTTELPGSMLSSINSSTPKALDLFLCWDSTTEEDIEDTVVSNFFSAIDNAEGSDSEDERPKKSGKRSKDKRKSKKDKKSRRSKKKRKSKKSSSSSEPSTTSESGESSEESSSKVGLMSFRFASWP